VTISSTKSTPTRVWLRGFGIPGAAARFLLALTAVAAVLVSVASAPGAIGVLGAGLAVVMLTIAVIDGTSFIIPNWLNAAGLLLALAHAAVQEPIGAPGTLALAVIAAALRGTVLALVFLLIRSVYVRVRGRQGLGLGDVKLAAVAGAWLDWQMISIALEIATLAALSAYLLRRLALGRPLRTTNRVPFGLFFAPAIWVCWLLETALL